MNIAYHELMNGSRFMIDPNKDVNEVCAIVLAGQAERLRDSRRRIAEELLPAGAADAVGGLRHPEGRQRLLHPDHDRLRWSGAGSRARRRPKRSAGARSIPACCPTPSSPTATRRSRFRCSASTPSARRTAAARARSSCTSATTLVASLTTRGQGGAREAAGRTDIRRSVPTQSDGRPWEHLSTELGTARRTAVAAAAHLRRRERARPASSRTCGGGCDWDVLFVLEDDDLRRAPDVKHYQLAQQLRRTLVTLDRDYLDDRAFPPDGRQRRARDPGAERARAVRAARPDRSRASFHAGRTMRRRRAVAAAARGPEAARAHRLGAMTEGNGNEVKDMEDAGRRAARFVVLAVAVDDDGARPRARGGCAWRADRRRRRVRGARAGCEPRLARLRRSVSRRMRRNRRHRRRRCTRLPARYVGPFVQTGAMRVGDGGGGRRSVGRRRARRCRTSCSLPSAEHATAGILRDGAPVTGAQPARAGRRVARAQSGRARGLSEDRLSRGGSRRGGHRPPSVWRIKAGDRSRVQDTVERRSGARSRVEHVLDAARDGDGVSISVMRDTAKYLGMAAANLVADRRSRDARPRRHHGVGRRSAARAGARRDRAPAAARR